MLLNTRVHLSSYSKDLSYNIARKCYLDKRPQFAIELTKKLNNILEIQTRLLTIDRQTNRVYKLGTRIVPKD